MKHKHAELLYQIFDKFLDLSIINKDSLLTNDKNIFTLENIDICINKFVDNYLNDKRTYEEKINEQFNNASKEVKLVFAHANWLWSVAVHDMTFEGKKKSVKMCLDDSIILNDDPNLYPEGFGNAGTFHKQNKYGEVKFNLKLLKWLIKENFNNINNIKQFIIKVCLLAKYNENNNIKIEIEKEITDFENTCAMYNILLHLCNPDKYERIASDAHKRNIIDSFNSLIEDSKNKNLDEQIIEIKEKLIKTKFIGDDLDFYNNKKVREIWNPDTTDQEFNELQGLSFKKNIILYGPPGTGKTYSAKSIAKSFIIQKFIGNNKDKILDYFNSKIKIDNRIKRLQLHSNYSYEDFIAGIRLINGETKPEKGYFLKLCEEIINDSDKTTPYVLILDEINRIDLARLFGEAFSAIENRDEKIDLSIGNFSIMIPNNLYIIGTMNEIDFSLERIDFALRRRFLWFNYRFNEIKLKDIIYEKKDNLKIEDSDIDLFIDKAVNLNNIIDNLNELGKQYEIGHTFFSEIIDISKNFKNRYGYKKKINIFKQSGPVQVLWDISINPMIEAFLGNLDEVTKTDKINQMKEMFINVKK